MSSDGWCVLDPTDVEGVPGFRGLLAISFARSLEVRRSYDATMLGYKLVYRLDAALPQSIRDMLRSGALAPFRKLINQQGIVVRGAVAFEGESFEFAAPPSIFEKARSHGIENRIGRLILAEAPSGGVAVDVGANYGFLARVMARAVGESGRVVAFEQEDQIANILEGSLSANQIRQVEVVNRGVGTGPEQVRLDDPSLALLGVDLLKVDVDGPELDILRSARSMLERDHPVVIVEMNRDCQEIYDLLREVGYSEFMGMSNEPVEIGNWPLNLIASTRPVRIPRVNA